MSKVRSLGVNGRIDVYEQSVDLASVAANVIVEQDITVTGILATDDLINVEPITGMLVGICSAFVKAADTVALVLVNPTAGALDPPAGLMRFYVAREP